MNCSLQKFSFAIVASLLVGSLASASPAGASVSIKGQELCSGRLNRVEFVGNHKTRASVIQREITTKVNAPCSLDDIVSSRQGIQDMRLFRSVNPVLWRHAGELVLTWQLVEKIYFLPIPRLSRTSDGELRSGAQLRWDNVVGRQHQMKVTGEERRGNDGRGREGRLLKFSYAVPRFMSSDFGMDVSWEYREQEAALQRDRTSYGESLLRTERLGVSFTRWLNLRGVARGLSYTVGVQWQQRRHDLLYGRLGPFEEGQDTVIGFGVRNRQESVDEYRLRGYRYGADVQLASTATGSDYSYESINMHFVRYLPVHGTRLHNLNTRLQLGFSTGGPFGERLYSLGGGNLHRGLRPGSVDGDILTLFNAEYLMAMSQYPTLRWALFADIGNTFTRDNFNLFRQKIGTGFGLRWKVLALSDTDLRADVAFGEELDGPRVYFASNVTF